MAGGLYVGKAKAETASDKPAPRKQVDWERIEADYRAGMLSVREIAEARGVSHTAIQKRAKANGWQRDLRERVMAAANAKVSRALPEVASAVAVGNAIAEQAIVDAASSAVASILISHRADIARFRRLAMRMFEELEAQSSVPEELAQLGEMLRNPDEFGADRLNDVYQKCISLPVRTKTLKDLADVLKALLALERQANSIDDQPPPSEDLSPFAGKSANEIARRLAFALHKGLQQQGGSA